MRGAGGAPRGLRVHQKPLQKRERNRRPTRLPQNQNTKGITSADATKQATRSGRHKMPRRATKTGGRLATKAKKQASRRQIRLTNRIFVKPTNITLPLPTSKGAEQFQNNEKQGPASKRAEEWRNNKKEKADPKQSQRARKAANDIARGRAIEYGQLASIDKRRRRNQKRQEGKARAPSRQTNRPTTFHSEK